MSPLPAPGTTPQDPRDQIEATEGRYEDDVLRRPQTETLDYMPKGPDPQAFLGRKKATGG